MEDEDVLGPRPLLPLTLPLCPLNFHSSGDLCSTTTVIIITTATTFRKVIPLSVSPVRQASLCLLSVRVPSLHKLSLQGPKVCLVFLILLFGKVTSYFYLNGSWACFMASQAEVFLLTSEVGVRMRGHVSLHWESYSLPSAFETPPNFKVHAVKFHHPPVALAAAASQPAPFHSFMTLVSIWWSTLTPLGVLVTSQPGRIASHSGPALWVPRRPHR